MKIVKERMYVSVLKDARYVHARVTSVTDQNTIAVEYGNLPYVATRLSGDPLPLWRVNRFGAGS